MVQGPPDSVEHLSRAISNARVDLNPHQVDAALFALRSPLSKGVILADEVGLGKTIEAALVLSQRWAERRRHLLIIVPASLRKQWQQELWDKFFLPSVVLEGRTWARLVADKHPNPFDQKDQIIICFQGFSEFVTAPPVVITGDNYESGIGVRSDAPIQRSLFRWGGEDAVHINVFNISKFDRDTKKSKDGKGTSQMRRLAEYIGESYFDYLANLPDLVVLMDEAHRYRADAGTVEARLTDYIVSALIEFNDIDYDSTSDLLYKLAGQVVDYLQGYLSTEETVRNVLIYYQSRLGSLVHGQMASRRHERATGYEVKVLSGHRPLKPMVIQERKDEPRRHFRTPVDDKRRIAQMVFGGFGKCLYPAQKFDSDSERRLAVLLENDTSVTKWVKPGKGNFQIQLKAGNMYEPDFVVEAADGFYLIEVKRADQVTAADVVEKAQAAAVWCKHATQYASPDGRAWRYLVVPDDAIRENRTIRVLANEFEVRAEVNVTIQEVARKTKGPSFRRIQGAEVKPFVNCVPIYDLKIAAGRFSAPQTVHEVGQMGGMSNPDDHEWVILENGPKPAPGMFVAQVVGESMNKRIPNGAWCVWKLHPGCDGRSGAEVVLAQHRDIQDTELGGGFTVKLYKTLREEPDDGTWRTTKVILRPDSTDPSFEPIVLERLGEGELTIIAEMVEVLG